MEPASNTARVAPRKLTGRKPKRGDKAYGRSRLSNGHGATLPNVDGRSVAARRYRDIAAALIADQGGISECSESRQQLVRRFAGAAVLAEQLEAKLVGGEQIDIQEHAMLSSTLVRLAARIGIDRKARALVASVFDSDGKPIPQSWSPMRQRFSDAIDVDTSEAAE
jgi:hypothetical protein